MALSQNENLQVLYRDEHLIVKYSSESLVMYCYWQGFISARRIQELGGVVIQLVRENGVSRVLNDNKGVVGPWNSIAPWVLQYWFPEMFSAGLKYFAWVMPKESFALLSARDAMPALRTVKAFDLEADALLWLSDPEGKLRQVHTDSNHVQHRALYDYLCNSIHQYDPAAAAILRAELISDAGASLVLRLRSRRVRSKSKKKA